MTTAVVTPRSALRDPCFDPDPAVRISALEREIETHRAVRSRFGLPEDPDALRRFGEAHWCPEWVRGTVSLADAMFLYEMVRSVRPRRVVEIGAGSGCSTAALLRAMADSGAPAVDDRGAACVQAFDMNAHCFFDVARPVGSALSEIAPELAGGATLHIGLGAGAAGEMFALDPVSLAFIDADHRHPMPTADLLMLAPALKPGAWVVLHDIDLERHAVEYTKKTGVAVDWSAHGAEWLFNHWPFEKLAGLGAAHNIGAIRMPERGAVSSVALRTIIDQPWECEPAPAARKALGRA